MKTIIGISGTTSVGKSAVAVKLAKLLNTEVISADSMQIYKGMDVGTAKITIGEMDGIKHHMIDVVEPNLNYSSFLYQKQASQIIDNMKTVPILAGGTGFYFDSILYPPEFGNIDNSRRIELRDMLAKNGLKSMQDMLRNKDIDTYNTIDLQNPIRVLRAIEIAESGGTKSKGVGKTVAPKYNCKLFILQRERASLYRQIDERIDKMIAKGLIDEVKNLVDKYGIIDTSAFSAIGYKEVIEYLVGNTSLDDAIENIKLNTRHYAKRQITYFKKMNVAKYIDVDNKTTDEVTQIIYNYLKSNSCIL